LNCKFKEEKTVLSKNASDKISPTGEALATKAIPDDQADARNNPVSAAANTFAAAAADDTSTTPQVNSVIHAIKIMELFAVKQKKYLTLSEISQSLQMHKTTVYRILRTLQTVGWVNQFEAGGKYSLGSGVLLVTAAVVYNYKRRDLIEEEMQKLSNRFNELVVLTTVRGDMGVCVDLVKPKNNLSYLVGSSYVVPFNAGATGKTLFAVQPDEVINRVLPRLPASGNKALIEQIKDIQGQGLLPLRRRGRPGGSGGSGAAAAQGRNLRHEYLRTDHPATANRLRNHPLRPHRLSQPHHPQG
jgi:DNA-binding IclR family transcriptional regulator